MVLTFGRCAAYTTDQDAASTAVGWAESFDSSAGARQAALSECSSRGGGSGCTVRVWGCNGPVVEEGLGLNQSVRRQVQQGLQAEGFDPGGADGLFGPRDACGDSELAVRARCTVNPVSGRAAGRGVARPRWIPASSICRRGGCGFRRTGTCVLAVDPEQHEPGGVRGVSGAAPRMGCSGCWHRPGWRRCVVPRWCHHGSWAGPRGDRDIGFRAAGLRGACLVIGTTHAADARRPSGIAIRPNQRCAAKPAGAACWMEILEQPGCHLWNTGLVLGATVTWTRECVGDFAPGTGMLTWAWDGNRRSVTERMVDGKLDGHVTMREASGTVTEGPL